MAKCLTRKQKVFVSEYLVDMNATQAAIRSGYSERNADKIGPALLGNLRVKDAVDLALAERAAKHGVTAERVINELRRVAFGGMGKISKWNQSGVSFIPSEELDEDTLASVQAVEEHTNQHGGSLKIRQHDKIKALELLGRHLKLFSDKVEVSGPGGGPVKLDAMSPEEKKARLVKNSKMVIEIDGDDKP